MEKNEQSRDWKKSSDIDSGWTTNELYSLIRNYVRLYDDLRFECERIRKGCRRATNFEQHNIRQVK